MAAQRTGSGRGGGGITGKGDKRAETRASSDLENTPNSAGAVACYAGLCSQSITRVLGYGGGRVGIE